MANGTGAPDIGMYVKARYPVIAVETWEESRTIGIIRTAASSLGMKVFIWCVTDGLYSVGAGPDGKPVTTTIDEFPKDPGEILSVIRRRTEKKEEGEDSEFYNGMFVLLDFHPYLQNPVIVRQLRDLVRCLPNRKANVVFVSPTFTVPPDMQKELTKVSVSLPTQEQLRAGPLARIHKGYSKHNRNFVLTPEQEGLVVQAMRGLTEFEAENVLSRSIIEKDCFDPALITREKENVVRQSGVLEVISKVESMDNVGGLESLKRWLFMRKNAFSPKAKAAGLPVPKGFLVVGPPGCGKTLVAKAAPSVWGLPLLRMDSAAVLGSHVGESESKMGLALETAKATAPCVLLLDEVDKMFMGHDTANDSGVMAHLTSMLLTAMQERNDDDAMVFVVATANDFRVLPEPMLRKGRFDEIWWVDLPNLKEREAIFQIHLRKNNRLNLMPDAPALAKASDGFIGSEIEGVIISAMYAAFDADREVKTEDIFQAMKETVPLGKTQAEVFEAMRQQAQGRMRWASAKAPARQSSADTTRTIEI